MALTEGLVAYCPPPPATHRLTAGRVRRGTLRSLEMSIRFLITVETKIWESGVMKNGNRKEATNQFRPLFIPS